MLTVLLTGVVAVLVFGTVVLVHEAGHYLAAWRCGIYVQEFSIGFGPAVWTRVKNGTRYSVRLFPVGGYNAMPGEENTVEESETENPDEPPRPGHRPYDRHAPVLPTAVQGKYFDEATPWQRFFVILCGAWLLCAHRLFVRTESHYKLRGLRFSWR